MTPAARLLDPERYGIVTAPAGAVCLAAAVATGGGPGWVLWLVGLGLLLSACVSRQDGFLLFGPFVKAELVRQTRRQYVHVWRTVITGVIGGGFVALALFAFGPVPADMKLPRGKMQTVAEVGFLMVFWHVFLLFATMTAQFLSVAVAEDREAKRLDFLLATDLRSREIVVGKTAARALGVLSYFVPILPLLLVMPAVFGVDPFLLVYAVAFAAVSSFSLGCLAALGSVSARTKKAGGQLSVTYAMAYLVFGFALSRLQVYPAIWFFPGTNFSTVPYAVGDVIDLYNVGNPFTQGHRWLTAMGPGGPNLGPLVAQFPLYAAFHVLAGLAALMLAVRRLRPKSAEFAGEAPAAGELRRAARRPAVYALPVAWKEIHCQPQPWRNKRASRISMAVSGLLFGVVPPLVFLLPAFPDAFGVAKDIVAANRFAPAIVAWIGIAAMMNLAGVSLARERERDTLPSLLATPLYPAEIYRQKFLGLLGLARMFLVWQLVVGVPGVITGAFPWWSLLGVMAYQTCVTVAAMAFGLGISATAPTVEKATRKLGLQFGGAFIVTVLIAVPAIIVSNGFDGFGVYATVGLVSIASLLAATQPQLAPPGTLPFWAAGIAAGAAAHAVLAWFLYRRGRRRFVRECDGEEPPPVDVPPPRAA